MADKRIDELTAATSLGDSDLLVVEQSSAAKKATGTVVSNYINSKFGLYGMASDISALQTAVAGKQDALTLPLPVAQGGTGATTAGNARINLGLGTAATADIDNTLSIQGGVADSATVGKVIFFDSNDISIWASGAISSSSGDNTSSTTRIRTIDYLSKGVKKVAVASGYKYILFAYEDGTYIGTWNGTSFSKSGNWRTDVTDLINLPDYDFRVVLATSPTDETIGVDSALNLSLISTTDPTLKISGASADAEATGVLRDVLYEENAVDVLNFGTGKSRTNNGVTYTFNADGSCTIVGTATGTSFVNILSSSSAVPDYIVPGRKYYLNKHDASIAVAIRLTYHLPGGSTTYVKYKSASTAQITIPTGIIGIVIRYEVDSGTTVNETVHFTLTSVPESAVSPKDLTNAISPILDGQTAANVAISTAERSAYLRSKSGGSLYALPLTGIIPFARYKDNNGSSVEQSATETGTDYIKCPKHVVICFNDSTARVLLYFYTYQNGVYSPRWDLLRIVASDDTINYLGQDVARNRTISPPDGTYMKICKAVDGDVEIFGWDGTHIGAPLSGDTFGIARTTGEQLTYNGNATMMTIPGDAEIWFSHNAALMDLYGYSNGQRTGSLLSDNQRYNQCRKLPSGYDYFFANVALDFSFAIDSEAAVNTQIQAAINLDEYASTLSRFDQTAVSFGRAAEMIKWAKYIADIRWTCRHNKYTVELSDYYGIFKKNYEYTGIPYTSAWTRVNWFGWHVSRHTWMNAANDPRSNFYLQSDRRGGSMGYGFVCSTYATLCAGWPYPQTTYGFTHDPRVQTFMSNQPGIGSIMVGSGHTVMPELTGVGDNYQMYTVYESAAPVTKRRDCWSFRRTNNSQGYDYINTFRTNCYHKDAVGHPNAYDIENYTITNGSARPITGDRGVFTSRQTITINIHNDSAMTLYYVKCSYSNGAFTVVGSPQQIAIDGDTVVIDKSTLEDGAFYGLYTDVDSTKEYFEYHVVSPITWTKTTNNLTFSDSFWYANWWQGSDDETGESTSTEIVPYIEDGDYSEYRKLLVLSTSVTAVAFRKGVLGAYVVPMVYGG